MAEEQSKVLITTDAKPWHKSRTIWFNVLVLALATAESQLHVLEPVLPLSIWHVVAFVLPVVNTALRVITNQGVKV